MPTKLLQQHIGAGFNRAKSFFSHAFHGTRKMLQNADTYSSMFRRVLAAAQPALEDLGVQDRVNSASMRVIGAYDEAKHTIVRSHERAGDHYRAIANAVN